MDCNHKDTFTSLHWQTSAELNILLYDVAYSLNGSAFLYAGTVQPYSSCTSNQYNFLHLFNYDGTIFYRLKIIDIDGKYAYSGIKQLLVNNTIKNLIAPTVISNGIINVYLDKPGYRAVEVVSSNGSIVAKHNITLQTGNIKIPVNQLAAVVYLLICIGNTTSAVEKIIIQ